MKINSKAEYERETLTDLKLGRINLQEPVSTRGGVGRAFRHGRR